MTTTYGNYQTTYTGGGNASADGGGFFAGASQGGSQAGGRSKSYEEDTLRPVTIKQILDASQATPDSAYFQIDGHDVSQVTFVGQVRNITTQSTHQTYRLDDGTAVIEVKKWIDADKQEMDVDGGAAPVNEYEKPVVLDSYVRVWGRLKSFNSKKHVGAHVVRPVEDFNEVNYHLIEATYCHLYFTRGAPGGGAGGSGTVKDEDGGGMFVDSYGSGAAAGGGGGGGQYGGGGNDDFSVKVSKLHPNAKKVCYFLRDHNSSNEGIHLNAIAEGTGLSIRDVLQATEQCVASGHAYTTVDDEHWSLLDY